MPEISKIKLPGENAPYIIKDAVAREMISGGVSFIIAWSGGAPTVANIPAGVKVVYSGTTYTGTLDADDAEAGAFYLVKSSTTPSGQSLDVYDEYVPVGATGAKTWEKIGDTQVDLSDVVTGVTLSKQTDVALGEGTTFTASGTAVGANGTAAAITGFGTHSTDTFVKSVTAETGKNLVTTSITPTNGTESVSKVTKTASKLVTTTVPNVTGNTDVNVPNVTGNTSVTANKSTWTFTMGDTAETAETLIIGGGNGSDVTATNTTLGTAATASKVTLGTAKTVATGAVDANGTGSDIVTAVTVSDKTVAKAGSAVTVATGATSTTGTGDAVVTGVTVGSSAAAITALGTPTTSNVLTGVKVTAQPTITVGENDEITVLTNGTDVSVTKGNE